MKAILAADTDWGIGKDGTMPWPHNSDDLAWFKECTIDSTVIMGRKTWDSLPFKPLPDRQNIIVSRKLNVDAYYNCAIMGIDILKELGQHSSESTWIIGGAQLLETMIPFIDEIWISRIDGTYACDTFLPEQLIKKLFRCTNVDHDKLAIEKWVKI
jgi:dihydrofolate reductase|tara:strand:- start:404 stop:871 length:468 start_codon:yes stop_codon:yes gene_type:complete